MLSTHQTLVLGVLLNCVTNSMTRSMGLKPVSFGLLKLICCVKNGSIGDGQTLLWQESDSEQSEFAHKRRRQYAESGLLESRRTTGRSYAEN
jgi:hypothetical protein